MASNIFSQTTTTTTTGTEVTNFQMLSQPADFSSQENLTAANAASHQEASRNYSVQQQQQLQQPSSTNESLIQAIKMHHHTKKFQINFSQINPLPIVDEVDTSTVGAVDSSRTGGIRSDENTSTNTSNQQPAIETQLVLTKLPLNVNGGNFINTFGGANPVDSHLFNPMADIPFGVQQQQSVGGQSDQQTSEHNELVPKRQYSTYIEMAKSESRSRLINRSVYVDPSPSGITRIHINHLNMNSNVTERIKEVSEKLGKITTTDADKRPYQRQNDSLAHDSSYISTYKKNNALSNNTVMVNAATAGMALNSILSSGSNNNQSRVLRFNLPTSPNSHYQQQQMMMMQQMQNSLAPRSSMEPIVKLIPAAAFQGTNQRYEEVVQNYKRDSSTSPFRFLEPLQQPKAIELSDTQQQISTNQVHRGTDMMSFGDNERSKSTIPQQQPRKSSILSRTQPACHEIGVNTTHPNSRVETVVAEEVVYQETEIHQRSSPSATRRKDSAAKDKSVSSAVAEIYSKPKAQPLMPRLERSKLIVVNLTPHPELDKMLNSESSETNNETNQRSAALKQIAETIEEEEEEPYPTETGGHRHRFDSNHQQQHNSDSNQDLHQLTPTSTKSILQQAAADRENNENHKKMHHDDDNILNGKSSTYYNDIRNKGSEMVSRTDSRRSRTAAAKENHRLTKLDFDQNQGKSLRRTTYQDENGGGGDGDEDDENNNVVLSEQSEIHFFNKLKFYRVPNGEGQITENFDYDQDPRVFYTTGARYKRNSNGSFGAGGSLNRLNPISENDEMNDQLLDPVTAAERFYKGENLWVPAVQGPINPKSKDEIILMKEGSSENLISEEEEDGTKKKKKNLKVKIKLPTDNFPKLKPKKQRHLQKCCLVLFLLTLFVIVTGILLYFFVWGYVQTKN